MFTFQSSCEPSRNPDEDLLSSLWSFSRLVMWSYINVNVTSAVFSLVCGSDGEMDISSQAVIHRWDQSFVLPEVENLLTQFYWTHPKSWFFVLYFLQSEKTQADPCLGPGTVLWPIFGGCLGSFPTILSFGLLWESTVRIQSVLGAWQLGRSWHKQSRNEADK